jgi:DNA sulfur modification protein DndB
MFPFSGIYSATKYLLPSDIKKDFEKTVKHLIEFWECVGNQFDKWKAVRNGIAPASELRRDYINTHVVILQAIGISGKTLMEKFPSNWKVKMKSLKDIDWLKTNPIWQNRILLNGRVIKSTISITLASNVIKKAYDINLTPEEQLLENNLKKGLKNVG